MSTFGLLQKWPKAQKLPVGTIKIYSTKRKPLVMPGPLVCTKILKFAPKYWKINQICIKMYEKQQFWARQRPEGAAGGGAVVFHTF